MTTFLILFLSLLILNAAAIFIGETTNQVGWSFIVIIIGMIWAVSMIRYFFDTIPLGTIGSAIGVISSLFSAMLASNGSNAAQVWYYLYFLGGISLLTATILIIRKLAAQSQVAKQ